MSVGNERIKSGALTRYYLETEIVCDAAPPRAALRVVVSARGHSAGAGRGVGAGIYDHEAALRGKVPFRCARDGKRVGVQRAGEARPPCDGLPCQGVLGGVEDGKDRLGDGGAGARVGPIV
jgi:hypothetical protein